MATKTQTVRLDLTPLRRFERELDAGMRGAPGPVDDFFRLAAGRYLTFAQKRFNRFSRGGGDWPPLAASTKKSKRRKRQRRGAVGARVFAILRDTNSSLFKALQEGGPGNFIQRRRNGIRVGIKGGRHPSGDLTIGALAEIHNEGKGRNPRRVIVPRELDSSTRRGMRSDLERALGRLGQQAGGRARG